MIISTLTPNGFKTTGVSANVDYSPIPHLACRLEARWFNSKDAVFETENDSKTSNFFVGASIAIQFMEVIGQR